MNIRKRLTPFTLNKYMIILSAILFIGGLITIGRYTLTDRGNKKIISLRQNEEITTFLTQELSTYLDEDQLITLSSTDGLTSTPEIIDFIDQTQDPEFTAKVDTTISCNYFFNNGQEGLVLTQQALCIKDESRQETITRQQFFQARADIDIDIEDINGVLSNTAPDQPQNDIINTPYQSLPLLLTQDPLYINQDLLQLIGEDLAKLQKDEAVQEMISEGFNTTKWIITIVAILIFLFVASLALLLWKGLMYIYNYLTFFAAKIRGYTYTRSQLFQYFWVGMTIFGIITVTTRASRFTSLISRFVISLIVIYINKQQETPFLPSPDQKQADSENNDKY